METAATIDGRYAAESDAHVFGIGGEGRSRRDGRGFDIVRLCNLFCGLDRFGQVGPAIGFEKAGR
jgi:hypothetical protein